MKTIKKFTLFILLVFLQKIQCEKLISFGKKSIKESSIRLMGKRKLLSIFSQYQAEKARNENNTLMENFYNGFRYRVNRSRFPIVLYKKVLNSLLESSGDLFSPIFEHGCWCQNFDYKDQWDFF